jgi:multicomponent Na+:H+ antiporter subunit E
MKQHGIKKTLLHFSLLLTFWFAISGYFDLFHGLIGLFSVIFVLWFHHGVYRYCFFEEEKKEISFNSIRLFYYIPFLLWEIVLSSIRVTRLILHPKMPIQAGFIRFKVDLPNITSKVVLGNSISLTPGTLTLSIDGDEFLVHALVDKREQLQLDRTLPREVAKLYNSRSADIISHEKIQILLN